MTPACAGGRGVHPPGLHRRAVTPTLHGFGPNLMDADKSGDTRDVNREDIVEPAPDPPLETLKHFKVIREIGAGGMGRVFKCLDTNLNRYVAVKTLRSHLARDDDFLERFKREALAVAKTRHPNIVQIYAIDRQEDAVFYSMEYVEGEGVDSLLDKRGPLPEQEAVDIVRQAAAGLAHVHRAGLLHRDIKPSNLLVDASGRILLTDFGLAKLAFQLAIPPRESDNAGKKKPGETDAGRIMGTPYYMAPECIAGKNPTPRSDLYSLGIVFYELLTGRVPFDAEDPSDVFHAHLHDIPVPIGELAPQTSLQVANIVYRCIEKNPPSRFPDCEALLKDLDEVLSAWRMAKEIEERKKLSVELAKAMTLDKRPTTARKKGPLLAMVFVVLAAVGFLLLLGNVLESLTTLPAHNGEKTNPPPDAPIERVVGVLETVERPDDASCLCTITRFFLKEKPLLTLLLDRNRWTGTWPPQLQPGETLIADGVPVTIDGAVRLLVRRNRDLRKPEDASLFYEEQGTDIPIAWNDISRLQDGTGFKAHGTLLWMAGDGKQCLVGEGPGRILVADMERPCKPEIEIGDPVTLSGTFLNAEHFEDGVPRIEKAERTP